jgi:hypothetical protein
VLRSCRADQRARHKVCFHLDIDIHNKFRVLSYFVVRQQCEAPTEPNVSSLLHSSCRIHTPIYRESCPGLGEFLSGKLARHHGHRSESNSGINKDLILRGAEQRIAGEYS